MLIALDAGNTNITIGVFQGSGLTSPARTTEPPALTSPARTTEPSALCALSHRWRLRTVHEQTEDEWGLLLRNLFAIDGLDLRQVDGVIISSVVPPLNPTLAAMTQRYFGREAMFVTHETDTGLIVRYDNPREVGADRVVNGVAAFHRYGGPCVVVDLGTAITFDVVSAQAEYLGGIICPGIGISIEALFQRTARLPKVDFRAPEKLIGTNTVGSIQSGLYWGAISMIDGIVEKLVAELGPATTTVATGGQARLIVQGSRYLNDVDEDLTLTGLEIIWRRSAGVK